MDKLQLVDKLRNKTNITYEEAKSALERNDWDILEAVLYLENSGRVKRPSVSIFYTNEYKEEHKEEQSELNLNKVKEDNHYKDNNRFAGVFEAVCKAIDTCNNIFIEIKGKNNFFFKIPLTVLIVLFIFAFWIIIPLIIVGLFFEIEFSVSAKKVNTDKVNKVLIEISKNVQLVKEKFKKGV